MKHTGTPWKIFGQDIYGHEPDGRRNFICSWSGRSADARLIAAAPDLLEALEWATSELEHLANGGKVGDTTHEIVEQLQGTLKKVKP